MQSDELNENKIAKSQKRLQMQDIARLAGVSTSTVSRALNGSKLVNEETRNKVTELAKSLNYSIDIGAQNLRLKNNKTIAVVIPYDPKNPQHVSEPFFLTMIGHIADELSKLGHYTLVSRVSTDNLDLIVEPYESGRAIGIIVIGQWNYHKQLNATNRGVPIVVWGAKMDNQQYISVGSNNVHGGFLATEHLIQKGCKNIAFFGNKQLPEVAQRYEGYELAHRVFNLKTDKKLCIPTPFSAESVSSDIQILVDKNTRFDGIFACSDLIAMRAISTLQKMNISVPEDVAIVGYDDILLAAYFHPAISTIKQSIETGAQTLVKTLFLMINEEDVSSSQLEVSLVQRDSSARLLTTNSLVADKH